MKLKSTYMRIQYRFKETSIENIMWWINLTPQWAGFSISSHENSIIFWIIHFTLLSYVNFLSNFIYPIKLSEDIDGVIKANTNLSVLIFTVNIGVWFLTKRSLLISTIAKVKQINNLSSKTDFLRAKHQQLLKRIKTMVLMYYVINIIDIYFVWTPQRMDLTSTFYTDYPCPGIQVKSEINKNICRAIIFSQDAIMSIVVINYQSLLLFFIAHTAAMYSLMSEEIVALKRFGHFDADHAHVKEKLSLLIERHGLLLDIIRRLRSLYNTPLGIDFGANAYCICLFFTLPLEEWVSFAPILGYCFIVFFLYCFLCQKLIDLSVVFESAVYDCGWESYAISNRKTVFTIMIVAQKQVLLQAGNIVPVNIYTFASAMQFMYKFVTALKF